MKLFKLISKNPKPEHLKPITQNLTSNNDHKIKIAQVITRMDWGGAPDIVRILCERLDRAIYEVTLIMGPSISLSAKSEEFFSKFKGKIIVVPSLRRDINIFYDFFAFVKLYMVLRAKKFDIAHTHTAKAGALGRLAAYLSGTPKIIHMSHGHNFYGYFGKLGSALVIAAERFLDKFTDQTIALTELERNDLISFKVSKVEKIVVVNSGLELDYFKDVTVDITRKRESFGIKNAEKVVGFVSRLEPVKGAQVVIEAARGICEKFANVKFLIAGEGSLRQKLEQEAEKFNLKDKCLFLGWREDVPEILAILDVLIQPSLNEAVGRIFIEAGASGVPVVATKVGGIPEIVLDGQTGILIEPNDAQGLAQAVISLLENEEERKRMGLNAKNRVNEKFSAQSMVDSIAQIYVSLISNKSK